MRNCLATIVLASAGLCSTSIILANETALGTNTYRPNQPSPLQLIRTQQTVTNPLNEIGYDQDEAYVDDIGGYWSYSSLHYYRFTEAGIFGARVNYATRYGNGGEQYLLEAYPRLTQYSYLSLTAGLSNTSQQVFPKYQYTVEPYFTLPYGLEISAGQRYARSFGTNIYTYTGSIGKSFSDYFAWFRPYHYTPKSSDYFEVGIRRFFCNEKTYVSLKAGTGKYPDIGDLPPLNDIIILSANSLSIDGQIPIQNNIFLKGQLGYVRQVYHSGNVREITDGSLGVTWQF
jgi:YaiO family outer membrane protein